MKLSSVTFKDTVPLGATQASFTSHVSSRQFAIDLTPSTGVITVRDRAGELLACVHVSNCKSWLPLEEKAETA